MAQLTDHGPTLTVARLDELEASTGVTLPPKYRAFLLRTNGGNPEPNWFCVPDWPGEATQVHWFFRVDHPEERGLEFWIAELRYELKTAWLPIAADPGGNFVLVGLGADEDRIFYWDPSPDYGLDEETGTVYPVAATIDEFLGSLSAERNDLNSTPGRPRP